MNNANLKVISERLALYDGEGIDLCLVEYLMPLLDLLKENIWSNTQRFKDKLTLEEQYELINIMCTINKLTTHLK
jgi:hypothetical protein